MVKVKKDLTGQRFGKLIVQCQTDDFIQPDGNRRAQWLCKCDCGNDKVIARGILLTTGKKKSCGCYISDVLKERNTKNNKDLSGKKFGMLTVIKEGAGVVSKEGIHRMSWLCKCDCGEIIDVVTSSLSTGNTLSCGCLQSRYEMFVIQYLRENGYKSGRDYVREKKFNGLIGVNGGKLPYDFEIKRADGPNILLECQGQQHFKPVDLFGGWEQFEIQIAHDKKKKEYALKHNYTFIELPYEIDTYEKVAEFLKKNGI